MMKKQGLIAGFALAMAFWISAASGAGPAVGDKAADGTVYAGISPDTHKALYATPADAPGVYTLSKGEDYCRALQVSGHLDWHVPSKDELNVLYENRNTGALNGTFYETGTPPAGWYWSSSPNAVTAWAQRFSDGLQYYFGRIIDASLRCIR